MEHTFKLLEDHKYIKYIYLIMALSSSPILIILVPYLAIKSNSVDFVLIFFFIMSLAFFISSVYLLTYRIIISDEKMIVYTFFKKRVDISLHQVNRNITVYISGRAGMRGIKVTYLNNQDSNYTKGNKSNYTKSFKVPYINSRMTNLLELKGFTFLNKT